MSARRQGELGLDGLSPAVPSWMRRQFSAGKRARRAAEDAANRVPWQPRILECAVADLAAHVDAGSVDIIFADPPYDRAGMDAGVYRELARFAQHALRANGYLLAMSGKVQFARALDELRTAGAVYRWMIDYDMRAGGHSWSWNPQVNQMGKPVVVLQQPPADEWPEGGISDRVASTLSRGQTTANIHHRWGQNDVAILACVRQFARAGNLIVDPFLGGGSTGMAAKALGCRFVGADIDPQALAVARKRLRA